MKLRRSDEGSVLIEMAVMLPLMLLIVTYMVDCALWIQKAIQLEDAAASAAAYGAIPGNATDSTTMQQLATFDATGSISGVSGFSATATNFYTCSPGGAQVTATTSCPTGAPFHYVKVVTSLATNRLLAFPGVPNSLTLPGSAIYPVEVTP